MDNEQTKKSAEAMVISKIWEVDISYQARYLYLTLLNYRNRRTHICCPAKDKLAARSGMTALTIAKHLKVLVDNGCIEVIERKRWNGSTTSNQYNLLLDYPDDKGFIPSDTSPKAEKEPTPGTANADVSSTPDHNNNSVENNISDNQVDCQATAADQDFENIIKTNIDYNTLHDQYSSVPAQIKLLDILIDIAVRNAANPHDCKLQGKKLSAGQIRKRMCALTSPQIQYVIDAYATSAHESDPTHQQGYLLTMLYYADANADHAKIAPKTKNKFHNFHQRDYDYDKLERQILANQWGSTPSPETDTGGWAEVEDAWSHMDPLDRDAWNRLAEQYPGLRSFENAFADDSKPSDDH